MSRAKTKGVGRLVVAGAVVAAAAIAVARFLAPRDAMGNVVRSVASTSALQPSDEPLVAPASASSKTSPTAPAPADDAMSASRTSEAGSESGRAAAESRPMLVPREGTIVVTDVGGGVHEEENGTFRIERMAPRFVLAASSDAAPPDAEPVSDEPVQVVRGRFRLDAGRFRSIRLEAVELGGRVAVAEDVIDVEAALAIRVKASWIEPKRLHVVDAATKSELEHVTVVQQSEWTLDPLDHPGDVRTEDVVVDDARSPILLPLPTRNGRIRRSSHYWVRAPGRAWSDAGTFFDDPDEERVELAPAASITVVVTADLLARAAAQEKPIGEPLEQGNGRRRLSQQFRERLARETKACLRVRRHPADDPPDSSDRGDSETTPSVRPSGPTTVGRLVAEVEARAGDRVFDALAPGVYDVNVEFGSRSADPLLLAFGRVALREGQAATVALQPVIARTAAVSGTLFVPESWDAATVVLELEPQSRDAQLELGRALELPLSSMSSAGTPGTYRWRFDAVPLGDYSLWVDKSFSMQKVYVGKDGMDGIALALHDLARVTVHVVDSRNGAPVEVESLSWASRVSGVQSIGSSLQAQTERVGQSASTFTASLPAVPGAFLVQSDEWDTPESCEATELHAGDQQVELRVHRRCGIDVLCRVDGKAVTLPKWTARQPIRVEPVVLLPAGMLLSGPTAHGEWNRFLVRDPGWYRIVVSPPEGFSPVASIDLYVDPETFVRREIELVRE